jgi:hypothetical protein
MGRLLMIGLNVVVALFAIVPVGFAIEVPHVSVWTQVAACARSCASSASDAFSGSVGIAHGNLSTCLYPNTTQIAVQARSCASGSCTGFASYGARPAQARSMIEEYWFVKETTTADPAMAGTTSSGINSGL